MIDRKELQRIKKAARNECLVEGLNPAWKRAYERLIDAADHLDAMYARSDFDPILEDKCKGSWSPGECIPIKGTFGRPVCAVCGKEIK